MLNSSGLYQTSFRITGEERNIDSSRQLLLYRITQEAINNIIKHANAKVIGLSMQYENNALSLSIYDDGTGFDSELYQQRKGAGIDNMKNRVRLMGGEFAMSSTKFKGTKIDLSIPLS